MSRAPSLWSPFTTSPKAARFLMDIEPPAPRSNVRRCRRAWKRSSPTGSNPPRAPTHYSTRIEGNRLTLAEAEKAIQGARKRNSTPRT